MFLVNKIRVLTIIIVILFLIFIGGVLILNKNANLQLEQSLNLKTTKLATIPWYHYKVDGFVIPSFEFHYANNVLFSSNGRQVAYTTGGSGNKFLVINGRTNRKYSFYANLVFSPNGQKIAYSSYNRRGNFLVINGQEHKLDSGAGYIESIVFSPNSENVAYKVGGIGKNFVVLNGQEGKKYNVIRKLVFSPDSKHLAYVVSEDLFKNEFVVLNGQEGKSYNSIFSDPVIFSPDSQHVAYSALKSIDDTEEGIQYFLVLDGQEIKGYATDLIFSPDSSKLAYVSRDDRSGSFIVVRGQQVETFAHCSGFSSLTFSPDSEHLAYVTSWCNMANESGKKLYKQKAFIADSGQVGKMYDLIHNIIFSPDGGKIAYIAQEGKRRFVVLNGQEGEKYGGYSNITSLTFSPDSQHLAYKVKEGGAGVCC